MYTKFNVYWRTFLCVTVLVNMTAEEMFYNGTVVLSLIRLDYCEVTHNKRPGVEKRNLPF